MSSSASSSSSSADFACVFHFQRAPPGAPNAVDAVEPLAPVHHVTSISVVIVDLGSGNVKQQQRSYIQPPHIDGRVCVDHVERFVDSKGDPSLAQLLQADHLASALHTVNSFVDKHLLQPGLKFAPYVDTSASLNNIVGLAQALGASLPPVLECAKDFLLEVSSAFSLPVDSLRAAAAAAGCPVPSEDAEAFDVCYAMAEIAYKCAKAGHRFPVVHVTRRAVKQPRSASPQRAAQPSSSSSSSSSATGGVGGQSASGISVRLRGLPYSCTVQDIIVFFSGIPLSENDVTITVNSAGRMSGEAYCRFDTKEDCMLALQRHKQRIGSRYIEVFECHDDDFAQSKRRALSHPGEAAVSSASSSRDTCAVLRLRGLPFGARIADVQDFMADWQLEQDGIVLVMTHSGQPKGEALVMLASTDDADRAIADLNRKYIGTRFIEVFKASASDFLAAKQFDRPTRSYSSTGISSSYSRSSDAPRGDRSDYVSSSRSREYMQPRDEVRLLEGGRAFQYGDQWVKLRGLPFQSRESEIWEFFSRSRVTPVALCKCAGSGEAFAEMADSAATRLALSLHKLPFAGPGSRYIEVFTIPRAEAIGKVWRELHGTEAPMHVLAPVSAQYERDRGYAAYQQQGYAPMQPEDGRGYSAPPPAADYVPSQPPYASPYASAYPPSAYTSTPILSAYAARGYASADYSQTYTYGAPSSAPVGYVPSYQGYEPASGDAYAGQGYAHQSRDMQPARGVNLKLRGLPFTASVSDIVHFFDGFHVAAPDVELLKSNGRANGEAIVYFGSEVLAQEAQGRLHRKMIGTRYVEILRVT